MDRIQSGDQIICYDREHTRNVYSAMKVGDAERCGCSYCLNFAAQRATAYPKSFRLLLNQLGIDPDKEGEVYECGADGLLRVYGGWFYFVGELIEAGERMADATPGFQYFFTDAKRLPPSGVDFGKNVLAWDIRSPARCNAGLPLPRRSRWGWPHSSINGRSCIMSTGEGIDPKR